MNRSRENQEDKYFRVISEIEEYLNKISSEKVHKIIIKMRVCIEIQHDKQICFIPDSYTESGCFDIKISDVYIPSSFGEVLYTVNSEEFSLDYFTKIFKEFLLKSMKIEVENFENSINYHTQILNFYEKLILDHTEAMEKKKEEENKKDAV